MHAFTRMERLRATSAQRVGMALAFVEAVLFGFAAALHFGLAPQIAGVKLAAPFLYPAGIVEGILALALLLALVIPGDGGVRAGRVLAAQILVVIGVFVGQVALLRGSMLATRELVTYGAALVLALASLALIASPATRRRITP